MAIPDYQSLMSPVLFLMADNKTRSVKEVIEALAVLFNWTAEDLDELIPSGVQSVAQSRVGWAVTYLKKAGLIESPKRSQNRITPEGSRVASLPDVKVNNRYLRQYPSFVEFQGGKSNNASNDKQTTLPEQNQSELSPEEQLDSAALSLQQSLADDLLDKLKTVSPAFFERIVVDLLVAMGYGGSVKDAGKSVGKSGDGGIDGIIKEDKLGLDTIYIQAKRWEANVGRPEVQKFAGALQGVRARKGVFITTSSYSSDALDFVRNIDSKIVLIDGAELSRLMIEYGVGVSVQRVVKVMRLDGDYFEE
jgi:restriction system protein